MAKRASNRSGVGVTGIVVGIAVGLILVTLLGIGIIAAAPHVSSYVRTQTAPTPTLGQAGTCQVYMEVDPTEDHRTGWRRDFSRSADEYSYRLTAHQLLLDFVNPGNKSWTDHMIGHSVADSSTTDSHTKNTPIRRHAKKYVGIDKDTYSHDSQPYFDVGEFELTFEQPTDEGTWARGWMRDPRGTKWNLSVLFPPGAIQ